MTKVWALLAILAAALSVGVGSASAAITPDVLPGPGPGGEQCTVGTGNAWPLTNTIRPGQMGFQTFLSCNQNATIVGQQSLLQYWNWPGGWLLLNNATSGKKTYGVGLLMTTWFACGDLAPQPTIQYKMVATWNVTFGDGYKYPTIQGYSPSIFSKCMNPILVAAY